MGATPVRRPCLKSVTAADRDVAALRVVGDLYQPAPDLGQDRPVRREVRERGIGKWREPVKQVADADRVGPIGQSGGNAGACACLGDRRRLAALVETREERVEGGEPLPGPVTPMRVAERQMRVEPPDFEALHGGQLAEKALGRLERHAQPPQSGIDLDVDRNRFPRWRRACCGFGAARSTTVGTSPAPTRAAIPVGSAPANMTTGVRSPSEINRQASSKEPVMNAASPSPSSARATGTAPCP